MPQRKTKPHKQICEYDRWLKICSLMGEAASIQRLAKQFGLTPEAFGASLIVVALDGIENHDYKRRPA